MTQKTMVIDLDRCIGCFACEVACKQENNVALGVYYNKVLSIGPMGKFPDIKQYFLPSICQCCKDAPCVKVCPTGATYRTDDGQILVNKEKCIGCKMCEKACQFDAVKVLDNVYGSVPIWRTFLQCRHERGRKMHTLSAFAGCRRKTCLRKSMLRQSALFRRY